MQDQVELSAAVRRAMRDKKLSPTELGKKLGVSTIMIDKIVCGDVVPSSHLEKQLIEVLQIKPDRVKKLVSRRRKQSGGTTRASGKKKAA
jgi:ribosome-binding protein aMBF1 (putative translation factor)